MKIKICGIQTINDITIESMVDYVGFIVGSPLSSRNIGLDQFYKLKQRLTHAKSVAVTTSDNAYFFDQLVSLKPDVIQLHGPARQFADISKTKIALGIGFNEFEEIHDIYNKESMLDYPHIEYIVVDTQKKNGYGGTGISWKWKKLAQGIIPYFIAGGLNVSTVDHAINETGAQGVDVSSGVEINGSKNFDLMIRFIQKVKNYVKIKQTKIIQ